MSGRSRRRKEVASSVPYFQEVAGRWDAEYRAPTVGGHALRTRRDHVFDLLEGATGDLLDVGCGPAVLAPGLAGSGWRYFGIDAAVSMLEHGREALIRAGGVRAAVADLRTLPFPDDRFDAVICLGVLDRVSDQRRAIAEIARVVAPGGRVIVSFPNRRSPYAWWNSNVFRPVVGSLKDVVFRLLGRASTHLASPAILHSPATATALFDEAGLSVTVVRHFNVNLLLSPLDELLPGVAAWVAERSERLSETRLSWLATAFLVEGRPPPETGV